MRQESDECKPISIITFFLDCKSSLRCLKASTPDKLPSRRETKNQSQMKNNENYCQIITFTKLIKETLTPIQ